MIYIFESELPKNKSIFFALSTIYGIGRTKAFFLCKKLGFSANFVVKDLSREQINKLIKGLEFSNLVLAGDLLKFRQLVIKKLVSTKAYRGLRRYQGLPVRGQRTHTNARNARKRFR